MDYQYLQKQIYTEIENMDKLLDKYLLYEKKKYINYKTNINNPKMISKIYSLGNVDYYTTTRDLLRLNKSLISSLEKMIHKLEKTNVYIQNFDDILKDTRKLPLHQLLTATYHSHIKPHIDQDKRDIMEPHLYDFKANNWVTRSASRARAKQNVTKKAKSHWNTYIETIKLSAEPKVLHLLIFQTPNDLYNSKFIKSNFSLLHTHLLLIF